VVDIIWEKKGFWGLAKDGMGFEELTPVYYHYWNLISNQFLDFIKGLTRSTSCGGLS